MQLPFPVEGEADSHVYCTAQPDDDQLAALHELVDLDRDVLPIDVLGEVGETAVRASFVKTKRYTHITQTDRLGNVCAKPGTNRLDLMVTDTHNGEDYGQVRGVVKGRPLIPPRRLGSAVRRSLRRSGQQDATLHNLRDTHASQLLKEGVPIEVVSKRLGHANTAITMQRYVHVFREQDVKAARAFDKLIS